MLVSIGALEVGFFYNTLLAYVLMTVAFYEMIHVYSKQEKEQRIMIKSVWIEWYYYFVVQFYIIPKTWLT